MSGFTTCFFLCCNFDKAWGHTCHCGICGKLTARLKDGDRQKLALGRDTDGVTHVLPDVFRQAIKAGAAHVP